MVDRGASLSWLSQYSFEEELLFAPLTGVEVRGTRVEGSVLVVEVRDSATSTFPRPLTGRQHCRARRRVREQMGSCIMSASHR